MRRRLRSEKVFVARRKRRPYEEKKRGRKQRVKKRTTRRSSLQKRGWRVASDGPTKSERREQDLLAGGGFAA
jgi:hypothetical protein